MYFRSVPGLFNKSDCMLVSFHCVAAKFTCGLNNIFQVKS
jgi:hypothetical protein